MPEVKITEAAGGVWAVGEFRDDEFRWALHAAAFLETLGQKATDAKIVGSPNENMGLVFFRL